MTVEDKRIGRLLEREIHRFQSVDVTDTKINVYHGVGYLGGVIRPAPGLYGLNMKEEIRIITESARKVPGLKSLVIDAKIDDSPLR